MIDAAHHDMNLGMVDHIFDGVWSKGLIERDRDQVVVVATHLGDTPFRPIGGPDTERPTMQLLISTQDSLVQVHQSGSKGIHTFVDLSIGLPNISVMLLGHNVVRSMAEEISVAVLLDGCVGNKERERVSACGRIVSPKHENLIWMVGCSSK